VHTSNNSPCTACCEPCHDVCTKIMTEGMALPCRALSLAILGWRQPDQCLDSSSHQVRHHSGLSLIELSLQSSCGKSHGALLHGTSAPMYHNDVWDSQHVDGVLLLSDSVRQPRLRVCLLLTPHLDQVIVLLSVAQMMSMCLAGYALTQQPYLLCSKCLLTI